MLFNSSEFAVFAVVVFSAYYALRQSVRWQNILLLAASYGFYAAWDWRFLSLIWISTAVDFVVGQKLGDLEAEQEEHASSRRRLLLVSLGTNLGILGVFKYFGFFADSLRDLASLFGLTLDPVTVELILPVGISFYTFQTLSYTVDIYRGRLEPTDDVVDFALFVAFFPQLVAGPIERAKHLLPQLRAPRRVTPTDINAGVFLILWGLVLKMAVADNAAAVVNEVYGHSSAYGGLDIVVATVAFAVQIYGDFAGYSSIARGLSRLMGIDLMVNFRIPYAATSPSDFWQRWHISLSSWLRDYLYIPLGGNRGGRWKTYRNLMITMLLGGLWHGAAWNFVLWGLYHGLLLAGWRAVAARLSVVRRALGEAVSNAGSWALMTIFTLYGWLLFRANSLEQIGGLTGGIFGRPSIAAWSLTEQLLTVIWPMVLVDVLRHQSGDLFAVLRYPAVARGVLYAALVCWLLTYAVREPVEFIYFAF